MTIKVLLCLIFSCSSIVVAKNKWECANYYWRDYIGMTPYDAVKAGNDHNGNPRYIGLVYIRGFELLPATILPKQGVAQTTAYSHILTKNQHVKILCSPYQEAFQWIHVESKNLHDYEYRNLIPGGSEVGESLYIGRVFRGGDPIIGKIFKHERTNKGIWFTDGKSIMNDLIYEVLEYDCNKVHTTPSFDVRFGTTNTDNEPNPVYKYE